MDKLSSLPKSEYPLSSEDEAYMNNIFGTENFNGKNMPTGFSTTKYVAVALLIFVVFSNPWADSVITNVSPGSTLLCYVIKSGLFAVVAYVSFSLIKTYESKNVS